MCVAQSSSYRVYRKLYEKSMQYPENLVQSHAEGLRRVKEQDNYIYLGEITGVAPVVYKDCDYALGKEEFFPSSFGLVFPEDSPYLPIFDKT